MWIDELVDTIEAMRKHIEALQQENEQLRTQGIGEDGDAREGK
jgi:hypothetical protein